MISACMVYLLVILKRMLYAVTGLGDFHDGLLLTVLVTVGSTEKSAPALTDSCIWIPATSQELNEKMLNFYTESKGCQSIPFMFYR